MEALMFSPREAQELSEHFGAVMSKVPLRTIRSEAEYDEAVRVLNALISAGGANETHALAPLVDALGDFIGDYEDANLPWPDMPAHLALRELMTMHNMKQTDLPEIGSQGVVSEILNGKRELNTRQIAGLARRFHVSPAVFFASP